MNTYLERTHSCVNYCSHESLDWQSLEMKWVGGNGMKKYHLKFQRFQFLLHLCTFSLLSCLGCGFLISGRIWFHFCTMFFLSNLTSLLVVRFIARTLHISDWVLCRTDRSLCLTDRNLCRTDRNLCRTDRNLCRTDRNLCRNDRNLCRNDRDLCNTDWCFDCTVLFFLFELLFKLGMLLCYKVS